MAVLTRTARTLSLSSGEAIPALGQGTWHMAEDPRRRKEEIGALRFGIDLGMTLIDTAEMYADGAAEQLVGGISRPRFPGQQGPSSPCDGARNDRSLRA